MSQKSSAEISVAAALNQIGYQILKLLDCNESTEKRIEYKKNCY